MEGGWNRWFIAKVCGIDGTNSLHTDTRAPRLPPTSFPSVNHRFEAVRLAKRLMCVAETRESPFPPPPAPHPVKRRFRIFRTATRSGGMLILSVDRRTNIFQPRTLFVERVSNALDFFFSIHWMVFFRRTYHYRVYIYIFPLCVNCTYIFGKKLYNHVDTWSDASFSSIENSWERKGGEESLNRIQVTDCR